MDLLVLSADSEDFPFCSNIIPRLLLDPSSHGSPGNTLAVIFNLITACLSHMSLRQVSASLSPFWPPASYYTWKLENIPHSGAAHTQQVLCYKYICVACETEVGFFCCLWRNVFVSSITQKYQRKIETHFPLIQNISYAFYRYMHMYKHYRGVLIFHELSM